MSRRSAAARRRKALASNRIPQQTHPHSPAPGAQSSRANAAADAADGARDEQEACERASDTIISGGAATTTRHNGHAAPVYVADAFALDDEESAAEVQWPVLASGPLLVEALTRTGAATQPHPGHLAQANTPSAAEARDSEPAAGGFDGLMDTWPGDESRAGRWWWNTRQYLGRQFVALRQGRLHLPRTIQPRIAVGLLIALGFVVVFAAIGTLIITRLAGNVTVPNLGVGPAAQPTTGIVLQTNQGSSAPTVVVAPYTVAAWVSNSAPPSFGTVQVYVRVTNSSTFAAQPGVSVGLAVAFSCATPGNVQGYGPTATDADGVATFNVTFSNLPVGQPVCITARASIGGQAYTATTTFAASGGIIVPTTIPPNPQPTSTPKHHNH